MAPPLDPSSDLRIRLDGLVRDALAVSPPASDLAEWDGRAEDAYGSAVVRLRASIDRAVDALRSARAAA